MADSSQEPETIEAIPDKARHMIQMLWIPVQQLGRLSPKKTNNDIVKKVTALSAPRGDISLALAQRRNLVLGRLQKPLQRKKHLLQKLKRTKKGKPWPRKS